MYLRRGVACFINCVNDYLTRIVCAAFSTRMEYVSELHYDSVFAKLLKCYGTEYWGRVKSKYFSPYMVLFQSSMTGKSRMLQELAKDTFFTITICLRKQSQDMPPPRTQGVADALRDARPTSSEDLMRLLIISYIKEFMAWFATIQTGSKQERLPSAWQEYQEKKANANVGNNLKEALQTSNYYVTLPAWKSVANRFRNLGYSEGLDILFVFDEARELLASRDTKEMSLFRYA